MVSKNFQEFKKIIQGDKLEIQKKKKDWWHASLRFISRYITWILVKTSITANFITITGTIIGLLGLFLIAIGNNFFIIMGFILLFIFFISDEIDGEVARYKKQTSLKGIYYDEISHLFFQGWYFISFGYFVYRVNTEILCIFLGIVASFFLSGIRIISKMSVIVSSHSGVENILQKDDNSDIQIQKSNKKFLRFIKFLILNFATAFSNTIIITTVFLIEFILYLYNLGFIIIEITFLIYSIFLGLVFFAYMISKLRKIDEDVVEIHKTLKENS